MKGIQKVEKLKKYAYVPPEEMQIFEISDEMRCFGGKGGKMAISNESEPHYGEKPAKLPELVILSQSNPLFWLNLALWVIFI